MPILRQTSIKAKLTQLTMLTSGAALLVSVTLFGFSDARRFRARMERDLQTLADVVGTSAASALDFDDEAAAAKTLAALEYKPGILRAAIFDKDNKVLASYLRAREPASRGVPARAEDGFHYVNGQLEVFRPIQRGAERVGTIFFLVDLSDQRELIVDYLSGGLVILAGALLVAFVFSTRLQRSISKPILDLAQTSRLVSERKDYAARARKVSDDEIGFLIDRFNEMLGQMERHEKELTEKNNLLRQSQQEALAATEAKSHFLANMSHELRTPLNAIIGYSEMLEEDAKETGKDDIIPDLKKINGAGKHLLALINDILDLSKIEAGKMELYLETFDLKSVLEDVVATTRLLVQKKGNILQVQYPPDLGTMRSDLTKIRQALFNLLSNASKFTEKGTITLTAAREPGAGQSEWIILQVSDSGIGITREQLGRMFQAFSQADASTMRKYGGTGLGLAITRHFCRMMGGDVTVASDYGKGSTFTIRVPSDQREPGAEAEEGATAGLEPLPMEAGTVLVVDDDPSARDLLKRFFNKQGFHAECAANGPEALAAVKVVRPKLITLDVLLPGMDGWAVLAKLKEDPATAGIPVIMLTNVDDKHYGHALGATEYLTKPVDRERLAAVIAGLRKPSAPGRALVVDDEEAVRNILIRALEQQGWTADGAKDGRDALDAVAAHKPDLILLDLMMPRMNGFEFAAEMRHRPEWRAIPIIVITGKTLTAEDRQMLESRVQKVLTKDSAGHERLLSELHDLVVECVQRPRAPDTHVQI